MYSLSSSREIESRAAGGRGADGCVGVETADSPLAAVSDVEVDDSDGCLLRTPGLVPVRFRPSIWVPLGPPEGTTGCGELRS